jgi:hypothetical protein
MDAVGGRGAAGVAAGMGCRGPDKIWPGRGAGTGRAGTGPVRSGGCSGAVPPADRGGLKGAGLLRSGSSTVVTVASWEAVLLETVVAGDPMPAAPGGAAGLAATGGRSAMVSGRGSGRAGSSIASGSATATEVSYSRRAASPPPPCNRSRIIFSTRSSMELEWVFFSETPSSGNMSMIACDGTSSCLASSLIRIFVIDNCTTRKQRGA